MGSSDMLALLGAGCEDVATGGKQSFFDQLLLTRWIFAPPDHIEKADRKRDVGMAFEDHVEAGFIQPRASSGNRIRHLDHLTLGSFRNEVLLAVEVKVDKRRDLGTHLVLEDTAIRQMKTDDEEI